MIQRVGCKFNRQYLQCQSGIQKSTKWIQRQLIQQSPQQLQKFQNCTYCSLVSEQANLQQSRDLDQTLKKSSGKIIQAFDYSSLVACQKDIKQFWLPAKIEKILMCDQWTWALNLRTLDRSGWLYLCWHPQFYHICASTQHPQRGESSELFDVLSKVDEHIHGLILDDIEIPVSWERVCRLILRIRPKQQNNNNNNSNGDGEEAVKKMVYFEGQGKYSNVILTNPDDRILVVAHQVGKGQSKMRQLQVGGIYEFPPEQEEKLDPDLQEFQQSDWIQSLQPMYVANGKNTTILEALVNFQMAISISQAKEICKWSGVSGDALLDDITDEQYSNLFESWSKWKKIIKDDSFEAAFTLFDDNSYSLFEGSQNEDTQQQQLGECIRDYYGEALKDERYKLLHQSLLKQVRNSIKKTEGKIGALQQQVDQAEQMEATKKKADLLMANAYRYVQGMKQIEVDDWETGEKVTIQIDEDSTLIETAEKLYKKTRKFKKAEENVQPLLETAKDNLEYLQSVEENIILITYQNGTQDDWTALRGIREELVDEGFMKPPTDYSISKKASKKSQKSQTKNKADYVRSVLREFTTPRGLTVLVGRNNVQNDELSLRIANKGDQWFHARGVPGAHVVLRIPAGEVAEEQDILFAADLAAYWSKAQLDGKVLVTTTDAQNVKKAPGGKPGMVKVLKEDVVIGRPDNVVQLGLHQQQQQQQN